MGWPRGREAQNSRMENEGLAGEGHDFQSPPQNNPTIFFYMVYGVGVFCTTKNNGGRRISYTSLKIYAVMSTTEGLCSGSY